MKTAQLPLLIPNKVRVMRDATYEVLYTDEFLRGNHLGECRGSSEGEPKQIVIKNGQSPTEHFKTFLHELLHAISYENDINLTENQVLALEDGLFRVLKLNGVFDKIK